MFLVVVVGLEIRIFYYLGVYLVFVVIFVVWMVDGWLGRICLLCGWG